MTFWLDAHLDPELAPWLGVRFKVIVKTLRELGLRAAEDSELFHAARRLAPVVIVTKDRDLVDLVQHHGPPPQIVWLRFGNMSTIRVQAILARLFEDALRLLASGEPSVQLMMDGCSKATLQD